MFINPPPPGGQRQLRSKDVRLGQVELLLRHSQGGHVPEDPGDQAEEDEQGATEDEEVPVSQRSKDTDQEDDESDHVQDRGQHHEEDGGPVLLHAGWSRCEGDLVVWNQTTVTLSTALLTGSNASHFSHSRIEPQPGDWAHPHSSTRTDSFDSFHDTSPAEIPHPLCQTSAADASVN